MRKFVVSMYLLVACMVVGGPLEALLNFQEIYPPAIQTLELTGTFEGDRHGDFRGDLVTVLSDGSQWKIHPDSRETYSRWYSGDVVRIMVRTDWYWFKREHKFSLYNYNTNEAVKVMLVGHKTFPDTLRIISWDFYYAGYEEVRVVDSYYYVPELDGSLTQIEVYHYETRPAYPRKILILSDGTAWEIKDSFDYFVPGLFVYLGAQGQDGVSFDFVIITGDQKEANWTWARPYN